MTQMLPERMLVSTYTNENTEGEKKKKKYLAYAQELGNLKPEIIFLQFS